MTIPAIACDSGTVLVASSDAALRQQLIQSLQVTGGGIKEACGGADALDKLESGNCKLLFLDSRLPDLDAGELRSIVQVRYPRVEVVSINAVGQPVLPESAALGVEQTVVSTYAAVPDQEQADQNPDKKTVSGRLPMSNRFLVWSADLQSCRSCTAWRDWWRHAPLPY